MRTPFRIVLTAAAALSTLAFASGALAANTGSIAISHSPMDLSTTKSTTIHIAIPQATDPIAAINIYVPTGYVIDVTRVEGSNIGTVDATALARDNNLTLPLSGTVTTASPASLTAESTACAKTPTSAAVWILNLSVAGQTIALPLYVNPTAGAEQALGAYKLSICLPPPDVPVGTPGRSVNGAQVLDAKFTVNSIFKTPTAGGLLKWEALFTPYNPGVGTVNLAGTFEARAFVPLPISFSGKASYKKATNRYTLSGTASEGGVPFAGGTVTILRGAKATSLKKVATTKTTASGTWAMAGRLVPKKITYYRIVTSAPERDYTAQGCANPITTVAPAGCVSAMLSQWSKSTGLLRVKP